MIIFDKNGTILECSDSLRHIMSEPEPPIGHHLEEVFLPASDNGSGLKLENLLIKGKSSEKLSPAIARLSLNNRPCRLIAKENQDSVVCWGEVIGDTSTSGLNEMSSLTGNFHELLSQINSQHKKLKKDLEAAAWLQTKFLPGPDPIEGFEIAWLFRPCDKLGGDFFNVFKLNDGRLAAYFLDVSGHGVPAAMMGIAVVQALQQLVGYLEASSDAKLTMTRILHRLEEEFPIERFNLYFTMVYLEIDPTGNKMNWVNAGHPEPILQRKGSSPTFLKGAGPFVGMDQSDLVPQKQIDLIPGDRIYLYSDGITERRNKSGGFFEKEGLLEAIDSKKREKGLEATVEELIESVDYFSGGLKAEDDQTLFAFEIKAKT
ncbi:MAG: PP2C family protein-serine/threonine phosphatase [Candidatus Rifleibacteriota bacterium]